MEPVTVTCGSACTVTHVVSIDMPPLQLTPEEGGVIAGAILAVWVVGWAFRLVIQHLRNSDGINQPSED